MNLKLSYVVGAVFAFILSIALFQFTGCERIDQGNVGLRVNLAGGDKGQARVQDASGWQFYMKGFTKIYEYPIYQLHKDYEMFDVPSKGGTVFHVHPSFNWNINQGTVKEMFQKYRVDTGGLVNGFIRNAMLIALREVTNRFTVDSILNNLAAYDAAVLDELNTKLHPDFIVTQFTSNLRPDERLANIISQKSQTIQEALQLENQQKKIQIQAENDVIEAKRDSSVKVIAALADARSIQLKQQALQQSPQYIEMLKAEKWNGVLPQYMFGNSTPMIQMKQ
jgi:regulator of protease activity HflC (stomatin/prohibitin superfamily)